MTAKLARMPNHPNRGANRHNRAAANPTPAEVKRAREDAGYTQQAFGDLVYKSWRIVQDWESGERRMPPDTWELIQLKLKALELLKRGRIAPADIRNLGVILPEPPAE